MLKEEHPWKGRERARVAVINKRLFRFSCDEESINHNLKRSKSSKRLHVDQVTCSKDVRQPHIITHCGVFPLEQTRQLLVFSCVQKKAFLAFSLCKPSCRRPKNSDLGWGKQWDSFVSARHSIRFMMHWTKKFPSIALNNLCESSEKLCSKLAGFALQSVLIK